MKKGLIFTWLMLVVAYAFAQEQEQKTDGWVIQGFLDGNYKADKVYLVEEEYINGPSKIIDSAKVVDNRYEFKGPRVDVPKMYFIKSADPNCLSPITPVFIENGVIRVRANADFFLNREVSGTVNNDLFSLYNAAREYGVDSIRRVFVIDRMIHPDKDRETQAKEFDARTDFLNSRNLSLQKNMVETYKDQVFAPFMIYWEMKADLSLDELKAWRQKIDPKLNNHPYTKQLDEYIRLAAFGVGSVMPNFTLKTPDGKDISLKDFEGKYVLVDFWASWCGPCLREMPNVVKLYKECKGKNFEIFGVSLDNKKDAWEKAIKANGMKWPQGSDLKGWGSEPARLCNVSAIPFTVLIDPEGEVIAIDLRGEQLHAKVKEVLGKK